MWPVLMAFIRRNVPYITVPIAGVIGFIGYNIESIVSTKYTPYNKSIQETRSERLVSDELLTNPTDVKKLKLHENVLERNLSPSLKQKIHSENN